MVQISEVEARSAEKADASGWDGRTEDRAPLHLDLGRDLSQVKRVIRRRDGGDRQKGFTTANTTAAIAASAGSSFANRNCFGVSVGRPAASFLA